MNSPYALQRWSSTARNSQGGELLPPPPSYAFARALATLATDETIDLAFVVIRLSAHGDTAFQEAIQAANAATIEPRLCLAVDCAALESGDFDAVDNRHVGLILDDVDANTPLSSIASSSIEAIRFRGEFVANASRSLRLGCVLESMLLLAHNLGLSTLGPSEFANDDVVSLTSKFDYTPSSRPSSSSGTASTQTRGWFDDRVFPAVRPSR